MIRSTLFLRLLIVSLGLFSPHASSIELVVRVSELPGFADSNESGLLIELLKYLDSKAPDVELNVDVVPFSRAVALVQNNQADIQLPIIHSSDGGPSGLAYSGRVLFNVPFAIYSNKSKPISASDFDAVPYSSNLTIETDAAHLYMFRRTLHASVCIKCSVEKVALGRVDALIYAEPIVSAHLNSANRELIHKAPYKSYPVKFAFQDTAKGRKASEVFERLFVLQVDSPDFVEFMTRIQNFDFKQ